MPISFEDILALEHPPEDAEIAYGGQPSQFGRLWFADGSGRSPAPVVMLLHGGCWLSDYSVDHVHALAAALAAAGYAVWAPEYRRLGEAGSGWPGTFEDVARGVDCLRELPPRGLDLNRVVALGHSAGGHLALWSLLRRGFTPDHPLYSASAFPLRSAVGLAAITDLARYSRGQSRCEQAVPRLLGGVAERQAQRYRWASPAQLQPAAGSPPVFLLQGEGDAIVPVEQARAMPAATLRLLAGVGHFDLIHPGLPTFSTLLGVLQEALAP